MNRISLFIVCFFITSIVNFSNANDSNGYYTDFLYAGTSANSQEKAPADISATISGTTSTCLNTPNPKITFTATGGVAPYKFTYKIDNGGDLTVSSATGGDVATIDAATSASGLFTYTLTKVTDSNFDTQNVNNQAATVTVNDPPVADFTTIDNQCLGTGIKFIPALTGSYSYLWDFGDSTTPSTEDSPTHIYSNFGNSNLNLMVTLTITDNTTSCKNTITKQVVVSMTPDAALNITGANGATPFDAIQQIFINCGATTSSPEFDFTAVNASTTTLTNSGYSIDWGDGTNDILPASFTSARHKYLTLGYFDLKVTTINSGTGCSVTKTYKFFNGNTPAGNLKSIANSQDCVPYTLTWPVDGALDNTPGTTYVFSVNDGSTSQTFTQSNLPATISHTFTKSSCGLPLNKFTVSFKVTNPCNDNTNTLQVLATEKPVAKFNITPGAVACLNSPVTFTNASTGSYTVGNTCSILFDKIWTVTPATGWTGTLSNTDAINLSFNTPGDYKISLKIVKPGSPDSRCTSDTISHPIHINSLPTATMTGNATVCQNGSSQDITFTGANGTAPYTFTYTLNGTTKTVPTTLGSNTVTISAPTTVSGPFTYKLVSVQEGSPSACSQAQAATAVVNVIPLPAATISGTTGVCLNSPAPVTFTGANGTAPYTFTYTINGGADQLITTTTGNSITIQAPTIAAGPLLYKLVSVQDAGANSCNQVQSGSATITVNPTPTVSDITSQTKCTGDMSDGILFTGTVPGTVYTWTNTNPSIGIGATGTGNINPFLLKNTGSTVQTATVVVTPAYTFAGSTCTGNTTSFTITVNPTPTITTQPKPGEVCLGGTADPLTMTFNAVGTPSYQWYRNTANNNLTGTSIPIETNAVFNPPTDVADTLYYYCDISFTGGSCSNIKTIPARVIVNKAPVITAQPKPLQTICIGGTNPVPLNVTYTGGAGNPSIQWYSSLTKSTTGGTIINGATGLNYTPPAFALVGTYYYYAEIKFSGSGCNLITSDTARINVLTLPVVTSQPLATQSVCQNAVPSDLTVTATGGVGSFLFKWYSNTTKNNSTGTLIPAATTNTFTPSTTGAGTTWYYCVISQPNGAGCTVTSDFSEVIVRANPSVSKQPVSNSVCIGTVPAALSVDYINGTGIPQYQWFSNFTNSLSGSTPVPLETNSAFTPPAAVVGTMYYYCIVTFSSAGCSTITSSIAQVTVNPYPVVSDVTYELNSGQGFVFTPGTTPGDIIPAGTTYTWTLPQITPPNSITGATAQPVGGNVFGQSLDNTSTGVATATYTVTPVSGQCSGTPFHVVVTVNPPFNPGVTIINSTCFGAGNGSISTSISGGVPFKIGNPYQVAWTGPYSFTSSATTISGLKPGNYSLNITDSVGYNISKSYSVSEPDELLIHHVAKNISCNGSANGSITLTVTGGTLPYTYAWKKDDVLFPGANVIQDLSPGLYKVVVTDAHGCVPKMDSIQIAQSDPIVITLKNKTNNNCFGDKGGALSVDITGGVPFENTPGVFTYTCSWTGPGSYSSTKKDITLLAAGIYHLTVTDNAGCTQSFTDSVIQPKQLIINKTVRQVTCFGKNDASIQLDITGGLPPYSYQWSNLGSGPSLTKLAPGTYKVLVIDSVNCQMSDSVVIKETVFNIKPVVKQITCFGANDGSIILNIQGGVAPVTVKWDDNPTAGFSRNGLKPGTYSVTVHDQASCDIVQPFTIIEPTELTISDNITNALDCNNQNSGAISLTPAGGAPPYKYSWSNGKTTKDLSAIPAGQYLVVVTDANGCTATGKFDILRPAPIKLSVTNVPDFNCLTLESKVLCTARITGGSSPYTFNWSGGTVSGTSNETMEATLSGIYTLGVTDGNGCTAKLSFNVELAYPGIDNQVTDCDNHVLDFNAIIPYGVESDFTYSWDFGDGKKDIIRNPRHTYAKAGDYTVKMTLASALCTSVFTKIVTVTAPPELVLDKLPVFCTGDSILLHVSGADTYRWSDGSTGNSMNLKRTGDYFVTGTAKSGCTAQLKFTATNFESYNYTIQSDHNDVTAKAATLQLWSETISYSDYFWDFGDSQTAKGNIQDHTYNITQDGYYDIKLKVVNPNGCLEYATKRIWITDASNVNVLTPNGDGTNDVFLRGFHIQVYNRNGFLLYDGTAGWDGKYNGKLVMSDTYFYVIYLEGQSGVKTQTGFVTVIL